MIAGFVLIHRTILDDEDFNSAAEAMAFAYLILKASWADRTVRYKGRSIDLQRGQLAISIRDLAADLEWSKDRCVRWLRRINRDKIEYTSATGVNVITIFNYDKFQQVAKPTATGPSTGPRQDRDRTATQNKEGKERNEVKEEEKKESVSVSQPVDQAAEDWNRCAAAHGWKQLRSLSPQRRKKLSMRLAEHGLDGWRAALARASTSTLLSAHPPPTWWTFDFVTKNPDNILKLMEGNYDRKHSDNGKRSGWLDYAD